MFDGIHSLFFRLIIEKKFFDDNKYFRREVKREEGKTQKENKV